MAPTTDPVAGIVDRPRLYRVLDAGHVRLCIVQGPSGCGKTPLVRSWLRRQGDLPAIWVPLGEGVTTRNEFWAHVARSASRLGEISEEEMARLQLHASHAADPVRMAGRLLAEAGHVVLILDAYEHLGESMHAVDADLMHLLAERPELRVVLTTRAPTRTADLDLTDGSVVRVVTLSELALTEDETKELLQSQAGMRDEATAASAAAAVVRATRGFALAVRSVVLTIAQLGRMPPLDSEEWGAVVTARLESLLPDARTVQFVSDTSVPPYVDVELGRRLTGAADASALFSVLERNGFGRWIPYAPGRQVFQYVETIRSSFRTRASRDPARFSQLCTTTAEWLLDNEEVVSQALLYALEGRDHRLADRVFFTLVIDNPDSYTTDRFLTPLSGVPEDDLRTHPMLAFGLALALTASPVRRAEAPRIARIAAEAEARHSYAEPHVDEFALAAMRAIAWRLANRHRESAALSTRALRLAEQASAANGSQFSGHVGTILRQLSYSLFQGGQFDEAMQAAERSVSLCRTPVTRDFSLVYAAGYHAFTGDVVRAGALSASIDTRSWPPEFRDSYLNGMGIVANGYHRLDALDHAGALDGLRHADGFIGTAEFWPFLTALSLSARSGLGQGLPEARRLLRELRGAVPPPGVGENVATERLCAVLALALVSAGETAEAARLLARLPRLGPQLAGAQIAVLLASGREQEAHDRTRRALECTGHTLRSEAETQLLGAVAALRVGALDDARALLVASAVTWDVYGPRAHVAWLRPEDRRRLGELFADDSGAVVGRFLDAREATPGAVPGRAPEPGGPVSPQRFPAPLLTRREKVVLSALASHASARDIAEVLVISPNTVKTQLRSIYRKLGASSRREALDLARGQGLLPEP